MGSYGGIGSFGTRPAFDAGSAGGKPNPGQWFKGEAAPFAGVEWKINDRWTFKAEYSSDAYAEEAGKRGIFERKSPLNFGLEYARGDNLRFGVYSLYGAEVGIGFNIVLNPKRRSSTGILGAAPQPVGLRPDVQAAAPMRSTPIWPSAWLSTA